jgi:outer membrane protein TolC
MAGLPASGVRGQLAAALLLAFGAGPAAALSLAAALTATLVDNRDVQTAAVSVRGAEGAARQARGAFDPLVSLTAQRSRDRRLLSDAERLMTPDLGEQRANGAGLTARVERRLASGLTVFGSAQSTYVDDRLSHEFGIASRTTRALVLGVTVPLARGSGADNAASATLAAAERDGDAASQEARYQRSLALRDTAVAYWNYVSSWRQLEISRLGEGRTGELLQELKKLIAADEVPAADLDLALANHAERSNTRIAAEQVLLDARLLLARQMGLTTERQSAIGRPLDDFPSGADMSRPALDTLREQALAARRDWRAQEQRIAALRHRLAAARDQARPAVDLAINVSSNGLRENADVAASANPFVAPFAGPALMAQLSVQWPVGNQAGLGGIDILSAQLTAAEIRRQALKDDMDSAIEAQWAEVGRAVESLAGSAQIVDRYARTLDHERTKRRLGSATLIDVLNVEDRYFRALLDDVQRRRNLAVALVRLGHELDRLLIEPGDRCAPYDPCEINLAGFARPAR